MLLHATEDWGRYAAIYNRCLTFAPYTLRLTEETVQKLIMPFIKQKGDESYAVIVYDEDGKEGIAHTSLCPVEGKEPIGMLHLLLADTNDLAEFLLRQTEAWARMKNLHRIETYSHKLNPYRCIMHGSEAYCWGGLYTTRNAFARLMWDMEFDIVNMYLNMTEEPSVFTPDLPSGSQSELEETDMSEDELSINGVFRAKADGNVVASCGYHYLKAISGQLNRCIGQIWITSETAVHGLGYGRQVITASHRKLYQLGARKVILATNNSLYRAIKFYQTLGYQHELIHAYTFCKDITP